MTPFSSPGQMPTSSFAIPCQTSGSDEAELTLRQEPSVVAAREGAKESCLVQIYPADIVDGMMLLEQDRLVAGRDGIADLRLPDSSVSRLHAEIHRESDGFRIRDLGSTNGTHVNGESIRDELLSSGDTIRLGGYLFKFLSAGSVESQYHETVYTALTRDALTGTMNKRFLLESMQREIARSVRSGSALSVLMVDIDRFKSVNDSHGHLVGDDVLREFGLRIHRVCREDDLLARYGGEEFCVLLSSTGHEEAMELAERFRAVTADTPFHTDAGPLPITASFGVTSLLPGQSATPSALIEQADRRLYQAKNSGRNRVCGEGFKTF